MKKLVIALLVIVVIAIGSIYLFIPQVITISTVRYVNAYQNSVTKVIGNNALFNKWWQLAAIAKGTSFNYKGFDYHINKNLSNVAEIQIQSKQLNVQSTLISLNVYLDSSAIEWSTQIQASANPFERVSQYNEAEQLKASMAGLMDKLKEYFDNPVNVYGIEVKEIQLRDSLLISTKVKTTAYPTTEDVYKQVNKLKNYAASHGAVPTDYPMLNVTMFGTNDYQVMVGLPVNNVLTESADVRIKRMPYLGNMLTAIIKGGDYTIQEGVKKLNEFYNDTKRASPAIPYELMITDRQREKDTLKWVTQLYYPVM
jgi:hypothetical protein